MSMMLTTGSLREEDPCCRSQASKVPPIGGIAFAYINISPEDISSMAVIPLMRLVQIAIT